MQHNLFVPGGTCRVTAAAASPASFTHTRTEIACYLKAYLHQESVRESEEVREGARARDRASNHSSSDYSESESNWKAMRLLVAFSWFSVIHSDSMWFNVVQGGSGWLRRASWLVWVLRQQSAAGLAAHSCSDMTNFASCQTLHGCSCSCSYSCQRRQFNCHIRL